MTSFSTCSTCSAEQWKVYGERMVKTFEQFWPNDVILTFYVENFRKMDMEKVVFKDLDEAAPWLRPWIEKCPKRYKVDDFYHAAARFAPKVAALGAAAESTDADVLIWLDGDTLTHAAVTTAWLESLFPAEADLGLLLRPPSWPETGIVLARRPGGLALLVDVARVYRTGAVFGFAQQHDAYVIGEVAKEMVRAGTLKLHSMSRPGGQRGHPMIDSRLSECLDHCKGKRKLAGRTPPRERTVRDGNPYWR